MFGLIVMLNMTLSGHPSIIIKIDIEFSFYVKANMVQVGKGPFKYYVSMFLAFFHPTHPPCNWT